jgi:hypothetical protein
MKELKNSELRRRGFALSVCSEFIKYCISKILNLYGIVITVMKIIKVQQVNWDLKVKKIIKCIGGMKMSKVILYGGL